MSTDEFLIRANKTKAKQGQISEAEGIEMPFCKFAERRGCKALKLIFLRKKGFPDRTVVCPGARVFFIEFKRPGKRSTGPQHIVRKLLESFGFEYYLCDQPGQAEKILEVFLASHP